MSRWEVTDEQAAKLREVLVNLGMTAKKDRTRIQAIKTLLQGEKTDIDRRRQQVEAEAPREQKVLLLTEESKEALRRRLQGRNLPQHGNE